MPKNSKLIEEFLKMQGTSLMLTLSLASILTVALISAVPNQAFAQQVDFEYRCYNTDTVNPDPNFLIPDNNGKIILEDQFGTEDYEITSSLELCNPALKSPEANIGADPLKDLPHLRCWTIDDVDNDPLNIEVLLTDQFSDIPVMHQVLKAVEFCHTTFKLQGTLPGTTIPYDPSNGGIQDTENIANWKCYDIDQKNTPSQPFRRLKDQFTVTQAPEFPDGIEVGPALYLCTPAIKTYNGGTFAPGGPNQPADIGTVPALDQHMKCYDIVKEGTVDEQDPNGANLSPVTDYTNKPTIDLGDQFSNDDNVLQRLDKICVDVIKDVNVAGTFIPIDSVAILLAGTHMTAAWILPALVASAGVGYGIEIARKYHKDSK